MSNAGLLETARHIRGSSLMVAGRMLTMTSNFVVQVLIVRYLTVTDYGAFAYALSFVSLGETLVTLGIDRAVSRFLPIYEEHGRIGRLLGTIALVFGTILSLGLALILLVQGIGGRIQLEADGVAAGLLLILVLLVPLQAADTVFGSLLAVFASPRSIFLRRYILAPGLRLCVVGLLVLGRHDVEFLAAGYVVAGAIGVAVYAVLLVRLLRARGLLDGLRPARLEFPVREILAYTIPLLTTDLVYLILNTTDALLLGATHGLGAVAALRVVLPVAGLNQLVISSFSMLYTPAAARLFARGDRRQAGELYWQTAIWMAVFTFPVFVMTVAFAEAVTVALFEERYRSSALLLTLLAVGRYVDVALGFNGLTLRVFGQVRVVVLVNVVAAAVGTILYVALIPPLGAVGAAIGTAATLVIYNVVKQVALARTTGIPMFEPAYRRVYAIITLAALASVGISVVLRPGLPVALVIGAIAWFVVLVASRDLLRLGATFPELRRVPVAGRLIAGSDEAGPGRGDADSPEPPRDGRA